MEKLENDLDIYYAVGNANTQRQENELAAIIKKRNSAGWKLISTSTAIVDIKISFQIFICFGKRIRNLYLRYFMFSPSKLYKLETLHTLIYDK